MVLTPSIVKNKFKSVFENNNGLSTLKRISKILSGEEENSKLDRDLEELTSDDIVLFKYSPITSVDVERCFSTYLFQSLALHMCVNHCTQRLNSLNLNIDLN